MRAGAARVARLAGVLIAAGATANILGHDGRHADHLNLLPDARQDEFMLEIARVGDARVGHKTSGESVGMANESFLCQTRYNSVVLVLPCFPLNCPSLPVLFVSLIPGPQRVESAGIDGVKLVQLLLR